MLKAILGLTAAAFNINKFTAIMSKTYSVDSLERLANVWRLIRETWLKLKISSLKKRSKLGIACTKKYKNLCLTKPLLEHFNSSFNLKFENMYNSKHVAFSCTRATFLKGRLVLIQD